MSSTLKTTTTRETKDRKCNRRLLLSEKRSKAEAELRERYLKLVGKQQKEQIVSSTSDAGDNNLPRSPAHLNYVCDHTTSGTTTTSESRLDMLRKRRNERLESLTRGLWSKMLNHVRRHSSAAHAQQPLLPLVEVAHDGMNNLPRTLSDSELSDSGSAAIVSNVDSKLSFLESSDTHEVGESLARISSSARPLVEIMENSYNNEDTASTSASTTVTYTSDETEPSSCLPFQATLSLSNRATTTVRRNVRASTNSSACVVNNNSCLKVRSQSESIRQEFGVLIDLDLPSTSCRRKVAFDTVTIHRHMITLGDNPATTSGPPLSLEWKAFDNCTLPLDDYEHYKPMPPRSFHEMRIPSNVREDWLSNNAGFARSQLNEAIREVRRIQEHRQQAASTVGAHNPSSSPSLSRHHHRAGGPYNPTGDLFPGFLWKQVTQKLISSVCRNSNGASSCPPCSPCPSPPSAGADSGECWDVVFL